MVKKQSAQSIRMTREYRRALKTMEEGGHVFLTGNAGTGKSTLLDMFRTQSSKKMVVLAPTGVASVNVRGQTIHSFFGFKPSTTTATVRRVDAEQIPLFKALETIVIDEISMVRADLLDCVDRALRMNRGIDKPFGGVQMVFVGDLFQLPPVVTQEEQYLFEMEYRSPFFFSAYVMSQIDLQRIELTRVFRQRDKTFIQLLNNIRQRNVSREDIEMWNTSCFKKEVEEEIGDVVHLTTTNKSADTRNAQELKRLKGQEWTFKARTEGSFDGGRAPSPEKLVLKEGAQVMFTSNDPMKRWVNGTLGKVISIRSKGLLKGVAEIRVAVHGGGVVTVEQNTWNSYQYSRNIQNDHIEAEVAGSFTQYPLTLAWAVTIHKAQGKTFTKILLDMGYGAFAHGQLYVALSRCTTMKGITLKKPFSARDVIIDPRVLAFVNGED